MGMALKCLSRSSSVHIALIAPGPAVTASAEAETRCGVLAAVARRQEALHAFVKQSN